MSEEQAAEQSDTLLDSSEPTLSEGEYYLTEGIKGTGEVPEWLDTKYKSVADQAKGYAELSKKFGGFKGAPKDGYTPPEGIESDDALYQELEAFATKTNMSADAFGEAWELLSAQDYAAQAVDQEEELSKLGDNAQVQATAPAKLPMEGGHNPEGLSWESIETEMFKKDEQGNLLRSTNIDHERKIQKMMEAWGGSQ
jgi:hypothetical protein